MLTLAKFSQNTFLSPEVLIVASAAKLWRVDDIVASSILLAMAFSSCVGTEAILLSTELKHDGGEENVDEAR